MERHGQNVLPFWTPDRYNFHFSFWAIFRSFIPPNDQKKKKLKKNPVDIIILHMCTITDTHMYGSGDMVHNRWTGSDI